MMSLNKQSLSCGRGIKSTSSGRVATTHVVRLCRSSGAQHVLLLSSPDGQKLGASRRFHCKAALVDAATDDNVSQVDATTSNTGFAELGVEPALLPGLEKLKVKEPSPIQAAAMPYVLSGLNIAVQSYTGSGKTLSYLLPVMTLALQRAEHIYRTGNGKEVGVQVLVVAPSQELAMQVVRVAQQLLPPAAKNMVQQCIGGANPNNQQNALEKNRPIVVVGTPGRLAEFMRCGILRTHYTPLLVLDEADQLLAPQFAEDMANITATVGKRLAPKPFKLSNAQDASGSKPEPQNGASTEKTAKFDPKEMPSMRQTILVSATLTQTVLAQAEKWCPDARYVTAGAPPPRLAPEEHQAHAAASSDAPDAPGWGWGVKGWNGPASEFRAKGQGSAGGVEGDSLVPTMPPHLKHYVMVASEGRKVDALRRLVYAMDAKKALVFMNFQQRLKDVQFKLEAKNMQVAVLHGEMSKVARANVLNDFKRGRIRALIVSDVVARGLDVPECDAVFHLELPSSGAHYSHRAGRTGRFGAPGTVVSLAAPSDMWVVKKLADKMGIEVQEVHVSHGKMEMGSDARDGKRKQQDSDSDDEQDDRRARSSRNSASTTKSRPWDKSAAAAASEADGTGTQSAAPTSKAGPGRQQPGNVAPAQALPKGAKVVKDEKGEYDMIIYDEEDEVELDAEEEQDMEKQLEEIKAAARPVGKSRKASASSGNSRARQVKDRSSSGGDDKLPEFLSGAVRSRSGKDGERGRAKSSSSALDELKQELEELRKEKEMLKAQRGNRR